MTQAQLRQALEQIERTADYPRNRQIRHLRYRLHEIERAAPRTWLIEWTDQQALSYAATLVRQPTDSRIQEQAIAEAV